MANSLSEFVSRMDLRREVEKAVNKRLAPAIALAQAFTPVGDVAASVRPSATVLHDKAPELQAAIDALEARGGGLLQLFEGDYYLSAPVNHRSLVDVAGYGGRQFRLRPLASWAGGADDYLNALWKVRGSTLTAKLNTTLTANAVKDARSITVAAVGSLQAGDWIQLQGSVGTFFPDSDSGLVIRREMVQVDVSYAGGTTIPLAEPLMQSHVSGNTVIAVAPVRDCALVGANFYAPSGPVAAGVAAEYATSFHLEHLTGEGLSRAVVSVVGGKDFEARRLHGNGEVNSIFHALSPVDFMVEHVTSDSNGKRFHSSGVARSLVHVQFCPTAGKFHDLRLKHCCGGVFVGGGKHLAFSGGVQIHDVDTAQALSTQIAAGESGSGERMAGWKTGAGPVGPSGYAEFGHDLVVEGGIQVFDCRHDANGCSIYLHDCGYHVDRLTVVQGSSVPGTMKGIVISDAGGTIDSFSCEGVDNAIFTENPFVVMYFGTAGLSATPYGGGANASLPITLGHTSGSIKIERLTVNNYNQNIRFSGNFNDSGFTIEEMIGPDAVGGENAHRTDLIMAYNDTGTSFNVGDLVKINGMKSVTVGGQTRLYPKIEAPTGAGTAHAVVAVGAPLDVGTGFMMICMLPARHCPINVQDANVTAGNLLESQNGSRLAVVNNTSTVPVAVAATSKSGSANTPVQTLPPTHT